MIVRRVGNILGATYIFLVRQIWRVIRLYFEFNSRTNIIFFFFPQKRLYFEFNSYVLVA